MENNWQSYEEVAAYLLNKLSEEFGLSHVEGKQSLKGLRSATNWTIDAKGFCDGNEGFVIIECRRYISSKQNQEKVGGLAYRILDTGAAGGIIVSQLGLQSGAQRIAKAENILTVELRNDCTPTEFSMQFLNKIFIGFHDKLNLSDICETNLIRICNNCQSTFSVKNDEGTCPACSKITNEE
jgi:hypothetical protein